jgi:hypothetical protein
MTTLDPHHFETAKRAAALGCATSRALLETIRHQQALLDQRSIAMGVGDGTGQRFVYGDYESIKAAQALILGKAS